MNDLIVLAMLASGPKHGYQLKHEAGQITGQEALHNNLIYPMLRRFTAAGWVMKKTAPGERGQTRQQYSLTKAGRQALLEELIAYTEKDADSQPAFVTRVGMFELLPSEDRGRILQVRERYLRSRQERLEGRAARMDIGYYGGEVLRFLRRQIRSELGWISRMRSRRLREKHKV